MPDTDSLLSRLGSLCEKIYWPSAEAADRVGGLDATRFSPLAELGLFGMVVSADAGGLGLTPPEARRVLRTISAGCGATGFMFAQHHGAAAAIATTDNAPLRERWLDAVVTDTLVGTAYAHVRRARQPVVAAVPDGAGRWLLRGEAPWATSWGTAQAYSVAAVSADGDLVWALLEPGAPGLSCPAPLDLMVFGHTGTVRMAFDDVVVDESNLLRVQRHDDWMAVDRHLVARPSPLALGVGDRALSLLHDVAPEVAASMASRWHTVGERAESAAAEVDARTSDEQAVAAARADVILTLQQLTTALLSVLGGRAAERTHAAQRLAREAMFYVVQGQAENGRQALLAELTSEV